MNAHASLEQLSGYLDEELELRERRAIEKHVGECAACRHRLNGLRGVVRQLESLRAQAPPRHIGRLVEQRLGLGETGGRLPQRLEAIRRMPGPAALAPMFGVLLALVVIVYLFSFALASRQRSETPPPAPGASQAAPETAVSVETVWRRIGERRFQLSAGIWVEEGIEPEAPVERLDAAAVAADPELEALIGTVRDLGGTVRLRHQTRVVEVQIGR